MKKRAASLPMTILVVAVILLIVLVIYLAIFQGLFKKEGDDISTRIDLLKDNDNDGVINMFDKCCCRGGEDVGSDGCPYDGGSPDTGPKEEACKCT